MKRKRIPQKRREGYGKRPQKIALLLIIIILSTFAIFSFYFPLKSPDILQESLPSVKKPVLQELIAETITKEAVSETITTEEGETVKTVQYGAVIGRPVKWTKEVQGSYGAVIPEIPDQAQVISITRQEGKEIAEYYTEAPYIIEEELERGKRVTVVGPETIEYQDVLAFTELDETFNVRNPSQVRIYWKEENRYIPAKAIIDQDGNSIYDMVVWKVSHLSNQTFDIIVIIKAEHLDAERQLISDIFEEVKALDGIWSETIPSGDYVRVVFERNLTKERDITLYPRTVAGDPRIEVYEIDGNEIIAEFTSIIDNKYNKVFLTNLQGSQDTFDLRVLDGDIEIEHIVDPVDTTPPNISFVSPTPANGSTQLSTDIFVNLSTADDEGNHYAFVDFDDDVFLWMRMDDVNGSGDPTDLSSYGNNGSLQGDALINSTGKFGNASHFDGLSSNRDFIEIPSLNNEQAFRGSFSISAWAKPLGRCGSNICYIFVNTNSVSSAAGFYVYLGGGAGTESYIFITNNGTSGTINAVDPATITFGEWAHVVGVYNQTDIILYVNSIEVDRDVSPLGGLNSSSNVQIGGTGGQNRIWNGSIDEVILFNRSLTETEISALYNASVTQYENNFTDLSIATHTFTGHAVDLAGNKNDTEERVVTINTLLSDCATLDQAGSTYNLTNNISSNGTCFTVSAENITLDGKGFTVTGNTSGLGIDATNRAIFTLKNITVSNFTTSLDISGITTPNGGNATIIGSNLSVIESNGEGASQVAGDGGVFVIEDSNISTVNTYGGKATSVLSSVAGGDGGNVTITNSRIYNLINASGGGGTSNIGGAKGGNGGIINIFESNVTNITSTGGDGAGLGAGGEGGNVTFENTDINLTNGFINILGGSGAAGDAQPGRLTLNYSGSFIDTNADYSTKISLTIINSSSDGGEIKWLVELNSSGISNLSTNTEISDNLAFANGTALTGLNDSANITLYGTPGSGLTNPEIKRDGASCPASICSNFTALDVATVIFNVSYWTNYSIGEDTTLNSCVTLGVAGTTYTLTDDIAATGTCFTVTADDITLDGAGFQVRGGGSGFGVDASGRANFTVQNIKIFAFATSVSVAAIGSAGDNAGNLTITNSTLDSVDTQGADRSGLQAGHGGDITIFESNVTNITAIGGDCTGICAPGTGGNGGNVIFENTDINLTNGLIDITDGTASGIAGGTAGRLTLNYSGIFVDTNADYGSNLSLHIINSSANGGEIKWLVELDSSGITNLSTHTEISFNLVFANGTALTGLNDSANITLFGTPGSGLSNPEIKKNSLACTDCHNFTSLLAATVIFNVTDFDGAVNYTIGENTTLSDCTILGVAGTTYTLTTNITATGTCFQVTADNITLDGNDSSVTGDNAAGNFGVNASGRTNFTVQNIEITVFATSVSVAGVGNAGSGGMLTITNSSLGSVTTSGTDRTGNGNGGSAGNINLFESNVTNITATGGNGAGVVGIGGSGGDVLIENTDINLTNGKITITSGSGALALSPGRLTLNYSGSFDDTNAGYSSVLLTIINSSANGGEILWITPPGGGNHGTPSNLSTNTEISDNLAFANGSALSGLNKKANITLYGTPGSGLSNPEIRKNDTTCTDCVNFTALTAATVIFNVTGFDGAVNYTIGENTTLSFCATLGVAGTTYTLTSDITATGTCFTVTANNITLDGAGFNITGNTSDFGVDARNRANFTIQNIEIINFSTSVSVAGTSNGADGGKVTVINSSLDSVDTHGANGALADGGDGGNINIFESNVTNVSSYGGVCTDDCGVDSNGAGGDVVIENTDINLTNGLIDIRQGAPGPAGTAAAGTLTLNYSGIFDDLNANYGSNLSLIIINSSSDGGEIKWLVELDSSGITNLSINVKISDNLVSVDSTVLPGLNVSANVSLFGTPGAGLSNPELKRDGATCASSICSNFTALDAATVVFNVSYWTNYSIGEADTTPPQVTITSPPAGNLSTSTINFNATVLEDNPADGILQVTPDGQGATNYTLTNRSGDWGYTNTSMPDNRYTAQFFINDSAGNMNNTEQVIFTVDTIPPAVSSPSVNDTTVSSTQIIQINITVTDTNRDDNAVNVSGNAGATNISMTLLEGDIFQAETVPSGGSSSLGCSEGTCTLTFYARDAAGNLNGTTTTTITVDDTPPTIDFVSPTPANGSTQSNTDIFVNLSTSDVNQHYAFVDFDFDLLLWMRMDEVNGGGDPTDISSYGNNGSLQGDASVNTDGYFGDGAQFDGTGDYINASNDLSLDFIDTKNYTWSMWLKYQDFPADRQCFISKDDICAGKCSGFNLCINNTGSGDIVVCAIAQSGPLVCGGLNLNLAQNTWMHVAITYNGSDGWTIYHNGSYQGNVSIAVDSDTLSDYYIGAGVNTSAKNQTPIDFFNGSIDEVLIFNRSLTSDEVASLYNASVNQYFNNFTRVSGGIHTFTGHAVDIVGNRNQTEERSVTVTGLVVCGTLDQSNTVFTVQDDITTTETCFTITADNITLDGAGFNIDGDDDTGDFGVTATGRFNVTIKNLNITDFGRGIYFSSTSDSLIQNNIVISNSDGIRIHSSAGNIIKDNTINSNTKRGIYILISSDNNTIQNNTVNSNLENGILIIFGSSNQFINMTINDSGEDAINLAGAPSDNNNFTNVTVTNTDPSFYDIKFAAGVNGTQLIDTHLANYSFAGAGGTVIFRDTGEGEIRFLEAINGSGLNLSNDVRIESNLVTVESGTNNGLNKSANITLFGTPGSGLTNPEIKRDGASCPASICSNFTALDAATVIFNVSYWTNYSIGEADTTPPQVTITSPPAGNLSTSTINFNATVLEDNPADGILQVTPDGQAATNYTLTNNSGNWGYTNSSMPDNRYTAQFMINDSAGNMNNTEQVIFTVDTTAPAVSSPAVNDTTVSSSQIIQINVTVTDTNRDDSAVSVSGDSGATNISMTLLSGNIFQAEDSPSSLGCKEGTCTLTFYAKDTAGNLNGTTTTTITVDDTPPTIDFVSPTPANGSTQSNTDIFVNLSTSDANQHYAFVDFDSDVVLWMRMDDVNGSGDPTDISSYSNNGSLVGDASITSNGYFGDGAQFDGTGDYINVRNDSSSLDFIDTKNYTWSTWLKYQDFPADRQCFISKDVRECTDKCSGFNLCINNTGSGDIVVCAAPNSTLVCKGLDLNLAQNTWMHVAITYNESDSWNIYQNGEFKGNVNVTVDSDTLSDYYIGAGVNTSEEVQTPIDFFNGSIDEVLIFNRSLTSDEIASLYNASANQYFNNFTGLSGGIHTFTGHAVDIVGNRNQTEERSVTVTGLVVCGTLDQANTVFTVQSDITTTETCFTIAADNITLDGGGFNIDGDDDGIQDYGVTATGRFNVTIKNLNITDFQRGIYFSSTNDSLIQNNFLISNSDGIRFISGNNNTIKDNTINSNTLRGIYIHTSSDNNIIQNNTMNSNSELGILLITSSSNQFTNITINDSGEDAITLADAASDNNNFTNVTITNTDPSFYDIKFAAGVDGTYLTDTHLANYSFVGAGGTVIFRDTGEGEIRFLEAINGSGLNLSNDVRIESNLVTVESGTNNGLNKSANITLFGTPGSGFSNPEIKRDGASCPASICSNFTALDAATVVFNVSYWTNYSIGEDTTLNSCETLGVAGTTYTLTDDIAATGTCFTVTADDITLDGAGFQVRGDGSGFGVNATGRANFTVQNIKIMDFATSVSVAGIDDAGSGGNLTITNSSLDSADASGADNDAAFGDGGDAGNINLFESNVTNITATGGNVGGVSGTGGDGGIITIENTDINLTNSFINITKGESVGASPQGTHGILTLNYSVSFVDTNADYGTNLSLIIINSSANGGEIKWIPELDSSGISNLSTHTQISDNLAFANGSALSGLNKRANITLFGTPSKGLFDPEIKKNDTTCTDCFNFTALTAATVIFNVTGFNGAVNYTLGEKDTTPPQVTITSPSAGNLSTATINFNVTVLEDNPANGTLQITPDGQGATNYTLKNSSGNWSYTNSSMPDNRYTAQFFINDTTGNMNNTEQVVFTVDTILPIINNVTANVSLATPTTFINITANITDTNRPDEPANVSGNAGATNVSMTLKHDNTFSAETTPNELGCPSDGECTLTVYFKDAAGNLGTGTGTGTITVSTDAPVVSPPETFNTSLIPTSTFNVGEIVVIKVNVTDNEGGGDITNVFINISDPNSLLRVEDQAMTKVQQIPDGFTYEFNYTISEELGGIWTISIVAYDTTNKQGTNTGTFTVEIPVPPLHSIQINLTINNTDNTVFIPGVGEVASDELPTATYPSPPHFYLASYSNNNLKGLVFSQENPIYIAVRGNSTHHSLSLNQNLSNSQVFLVFTTGSYQVIDNRMSLIEEGAFLSETLPSFSLGLGGPPTLKIVLNYPQIDIQGNLSIRNREVRLIVENLGERNGKEVINIEVI